jgi:ATP-dependent DNA helicase DinG
MTGDKSECLDVPETSGAWSRATSTRENCLGSGCGDYKECFVMKARKRASEADVVVVNHHLFFADVVLRDEGMADLLPNADTVVFDEAHHLPDLARLFFGETLATAQAVELARDAKSPPPLQRIASAAGCGGRDRAARTCASPQQWPGARRSSLRSRADFDKSLDGRASLSWLLA